MFKMDFLYTIIALIAMTLMYLLISKTHKHRSGLESIFQGAVYQLSMKLKLFVQRSDNTKGANSWRPAAVCVSSDSFQREKAFDLLSWISYKYGYGTYIHLIKGFFEKETYQKANLIKEDLLKRTNSKKHNVFIDTMISPSYTSAIAQIVQLPGISGMENNMVIFEFFKEDKKGLEQILENYPIVRDARHDICILRSTNKTINFKNGIDIWVHHRDVDNVNLMILLAYVILAHPDWRKAKVKVYFISGVKEIEVSKTQLLDLIKQGRIPMSEKNVEEVVVPEKGGAFRIINEKSKEAGLTIIGFNEESFENNQDRLFTSFEDLSDVLFVNSYRKKVIK
jgi:hypothetical protein